DIFDVVVADDVIGGVVAPFVWVADFDLDGLELHDRLLARFGAHPIERGDVVAKSGDQVVDHLRGCSFCFRWESALHVELPEIFSEVTVSGLNATAPARKDFLRAGKRLAVEIEILVDEGGRKRRRG